MNITESAKTALKSMKPSNKIQQVITELTTKIGIDLVDNDFSIQIDNEPHHLCIDKIDTNLVCVAHYVEQNGSMIPNPDMLFLMIGESWYPISFQTMAMYDESVEYDNKGHIVSILAEMKSMVSFTSTWADSISAQGYLEKVVPIQQNDTDREAKVLSFCRHAAVEAGATNPA